MPTAILKVPSHILGRRILLVEDEPLVAMTMKRMLSAAGVRVLGPAVSVTSALALIVAERPDAAVLDLKLGGESITPVARRLKELGVPFFLSATQEALRNGSEAAFSGVANLGKPIAPARCVQALGEILGESLRLSPASTSTG